MKKLFLITLLAGTAVGAHAQSAEDSVKSVINVLFYAMKNSDSALLKSVFTDSAVLQTVAKNKAGEKRVQNESVEAFAASISRLPVGAADERIVFKSIQIDGELASAWTPYSFFFNGAFSHCGVNSFQLVRLKNSWKIQYIIDTRRRDHCE